MRRRPSHQSRTAGVEGMLGNTSADESSACGLGSLPYQARCWRGQHGDILLYTGPAATLSVPPRTSPALYGESYGYEKEA